MFCLVPIYILQIFLYFTLLFIIIYRGEKIIIIIIKKLKKLTLDYLLDYLLLVVMFFVKSTLTVTGRHIPS